MKVQALGTLLPLVGLHHVVVRAHVAVGEAAGVGVTAHEATLSPRNVRFKRGRAAFMQCAGLHCALRSLCTYNVQTERSKVTLLVSDKNILSLQFGYNCEGRAKSTPWTGGKNIFLATSDQELCFSYLRRNNVFSLMRRHGVPLWRGVLLRFGLCIGPGGGLAKPGSGVGTQRQSRKSSVTPGAVRGSSADALASASASRLASEPRSNPQPTS